MFKVYLRQFTSFLSIENKVPTESRMLLRTWYFLSKENNAPEDPQAAIKAENRKKNLFITLIGVDGKPSTSTLEAANKLSKRRDLKLIKVSDFDPRREGPVYKLLSSAQILGEDIEHKKRNKSKESSNKSEKIISLTYRISEHDLKSKIQQMNKWLTKKHEVRVTVSGTPDNNLAESVYQKIETEMKENGRILQKRNNGSDIKFSIVPLKDDPSKTPTTNPVKS